MWCWNRLQHACNYNSWFSISPWDKNFCVKDERCPSPLSPNTHVQTERASSRICPVISTAAAEVTVVAHSHLEGTYMLLFDPATLPLWSTIKRYTFSADVAEWLTFTLKQGQSKLTVGSRTRLLEDLWRSSVTPLWKRWRLSTGVGTCWKCAPQPHRSFAVRRACLLAGELNGKETETVEVPPPIPPSQIPRSTESNRSRDRYRWGKEGVAGTKRASLVDWPTTASAKKQNPQSPSSPGSLLLCSWWQRKNPSLPPDSKRRKRRSSWFLVCWSLEMGPEQQRRSRWSRWNTRKLPRRWRGGVKFRHGLAPGSEKSQW